MDYYYDFGGAAEQEGKYQLALSAYRQGVAVKPDYARLHIHIGDTCFKLKQYSEAVAAYRQAIRLIPDQQFPDLELNTDAHFGLGMTYLAMGQKNQALQIYRTLQRLDRK